MLTLLSVSSCTLMLVDPALGAVLYHVNDDGMDASRSLTKAETHYPAHKLEFLTLMWDVVEKFHEYLYGLILMFIPTIIPSPTF